MSHTGRCPLFVSAAAFVLSCAVGSAHAADSVAGQFAEWSGDSTVSRQMTLRELGFRQPLVLSGQESQREVYLPVPAGVATRDAQLQLDGRYAWPRRANFRPVVGGWRSDRRAFDHRCPGRCQPAAGHRWRTPPERLRAGRCRLVVDRVRLPMPTRARRRTCRLSPDSRFSYRFDGRAVDTVAGLGALPPRVRLLVEGRCRRPPMMPPGALVPRCRPEANRYRWWRCPRSATASTWPASASRPACRACRRTPRWPRASACTRSGPGRSGSAAVVA